MVQNEPFWEGVKQAFLMPASPAQAPSMNGMQGAPAGAQPGGIVSKPKTAPPLGMKMTPARPTPPG